MAQRSDARPRGPGRGPGPTTWFLSPTDLTFLWDECRRCFYRKVVLREPRPRAPFPGVFGRIDGAMKAFYVGQRTESLVPGMAPGLIGAGDRWVKAAPIVPPGCASACVIRGRVDVLVACDDGTTAVVDFKTAEPGPAAVAKYCRQLHAYATALEHPATGPATAVSQLGLVCFCPRTYEAEEARAKLHGDLAWVEVARDDDVFLGFLTDVVTLLECDQLPPPAAECPWCSWRSRPRDAG